ncbi:MAG: abortive infection protein [Alphaproteobacteria bacterium]|nr:abortive infection protein [Alphaproteobacteria bacterium]
MLRKLTIENFFSIKKEVVLNFVVAQNATDPDGRFARPIPTSSSRFPKAIVLFGANASGKTNVLRSVAFLADFVRNSSTWPPENAIPYLPFDHATPDSPNTRFTVEFDAAFFREDESRKIYIYELEINSLRQVVVAEKLRYFPERKGRWLFQRSNDEIEAGKDFDLPKRDPVRKKVRKNTSIISTLAQFNHHFALAIRAGLGVATNVGLPGKINFNETAVTKLYRADNEAFVALKRYVNKFDFGITDIDIRPRTDGETPRFYHSGLSTPVDYVFESQGTQNFYKSFLPLALTLRHGGVAVMDELDSDIHPLLLPEIVRLFQSPESNRFDAQLIMSCHNPILFEILNKEEIFFTEKDDKGQTHAYGLKDIQAVRRDTNIYAKYLAGAFGAVPRIG